MKLLVALLVFITAQVHAQNPLTVTNTFTNGEIIDADQINENFTSITNAINNLPRRLVVYEGLELLGDLLGTNVIRSSNGYFIRIAWYQPGANPYHKENGVAQIDNTYYLSNDCSGPAYIIVYTDNNDGIIFQNSSNKTVFWVTFSSQLSYVNPLSTPAYLTHQSRWTQELGCHVSAGDSFNLVDVIPNDPSVTGFPSLTNKILNQLRIEQE